MQRLFLSSGGKSKGDFWEGTGEGGADTGPKVRSRALASALPFSTGIGVGLVGFGLFFLLFGILLYFDSVLMAFGNVSRAGPGGPTAGSRSCPDPLLSSPSSSQLLFLSGLVFIIGFRRTFTFFFQRSKLKGTSFFFGGLIVVLMRWPILGMLLEAYGFISLFRCGVGSSGWDPRDGILRMGSSGMLPGAQQGLLCPHRSFFPVAFGFFGSLLNIPLLSQVRRG